MNIHIHTTARVLARFKVLSALIRIGDYMNNTAAKKIEDNKDGLLNKKLVFVVHARYEIDIGALSRDDKFDLHNKLADDLHKVSFDNAFTDLSGRLLVKRGEWMYVPDGPTNPQG